MSALRLSFSIFLVSLVWAAVAAGADPAGVVVAAVGKVVAKDAKGVARDLKVKDAIAVGDTITTAKRARVQIQFTDKTLVSLGRNTIWTLEEYEYKPKQKKGSFRAKVEKGAFRVMGGGIVKIAPKKFITSTPTAVIGVRGSYYQGLQKGLQLHVQYLGGHSVSLSSAGRTVWLGSARPFSSVLGLGQAPARPGRVNLPIMIEIIQALRPPRDSGLAGQPPIVRDYPAPQTIDTTQPDTQDGSIPLLDNWGDWQQNDFAREEEKAFMPPSPPPAPPPLSAAATYLNSLIAGGTTYTAWYDSSGHSMTYNGSPLSSTLITIPVDIGAGSATIPSGGYMKGFSGIEFVQTDFIGSISGDTFTLTPTNFFSNIGGPPIFGVPTGSGSGTFSGNRAQTAAGSLTATFSGNTATATFTNAVRVSETPAWP